MQLSLVVLEVAAAVGAAAFLVVHMFSRSHLEVFTVFCLPVCIPACLPHFDCEFHLPITLRAFLPFVCRTITLMSRFVRVPLSLAGSFQVGKSIRVQVYHF